jgi:hypothetical protein
LNIRNLRGLRLRLPLNNRPSQSTASRPEPTAVRRVRAARLRGADRALANALSQLRDGVPLNWTQMEDDPELPVLASLHEVAQECVDRVAGDAPAELRANLLAHLDKKLPEFKPEPVKAPPRTLAGFSERVQVLTQTEEEVPPLITNVPQWIAATVTTSLVVAFILSWVSSNVQAGMRPTFTWIEVRQGDRVLAKRALPAGWKGQDCGKFITGSEFTRRKFNTASAPLTREFIGVPPANVQSYIGFSIDTLPPRLSIGSEITQTYDLHSSGGAIATCTEEVPDPADKAAVAQVEYDTYKDLGGGSTRIGHMSVFQAVEQPVTISVPTSGLKEVRVGGTRGLYWRGSAYTDISGRTWSGQVNLIAVERNGLVTMLVGDGEEGVTEELLMWVVGHFDEAQAAREIEESRPVPTFTWIELRRANRVISEPEPPADWQYTECHPSLIGQGGTMTLDVAQQYGGFQLATLPVTATLPGSVFRVPVPTGPAAGTPTAVIRPTGGSSVYNFRLSEIWYAACVSNAFGQTISPVIRLGYTLRPSQGSSQGPQPVQGAGRTIDLSQSGRHIVSLDITRTRWEEVRVGTLHGIFFEVEPEAFYFDPIGRPWRGGTNVLTLEKDDMVYTFVSVESKELLMETAKLLEARIPTTKRSLYVAPADSETK